MGTLTQKTSKKSPGSPSPASSTDSGRHRVIEAHERGLTDQEAPEASLSQQAEAPDWGDGRPVSPDLEYHSGRSRS